MTTILRVRALLIASVLTLLFGPTTAEAQKALVYCPAIDQSGCTTVKAALTSAFPGGVDIGDDGANGTVDLRTADLFQYAVFFVPSLAQTDSAAPYARLREQVVVDRLKAALLGRRAFWSGTPDQGALATTRPQKDELIRNLAAWASADFGTVNAPGLVVLQDNSDVVTQRYSWVQPIVGFQIVADPRLASYSSVRSLTAAGNAILSSNGSTLAYSNMASFGFQTPSGASGVSLDAVGQTGTSVGGQVVLLTQMGANTGGAVIQTDTDDYPPGTPVIMTGSGFQAGETVTLTLHEDPLLHPDRVHTATADANGGFVYSGFAPEQHDVNVRFILTAKGQTSGRVAQTTFTDANAFVISPGTQSVAAGSANTLVFTFTAANGGNSPNSQTFTIPTGWTAPQTGAGPGQVTVTAGTCTVTRSVSGMVVTITGTNTCSNNTTFTLTYANAVAPTPAATQSYQFVVSGSTGPSVTVTAKQNQTTAVNVTGMPAGPVQFGASFIVSASGGNGTGAYNFSATGSCTVGLTSGVVNITSGAGVCSVTAIRLGDANFNDSAPSAAATVNATVATQPAVTLTVPSSTAYPTGFSATASGGAAGAAFTYSTSSLACSVAQNSGVVTIISTGTCSITATAKAANYADATDTKSTTITPGTQPAVTLTLPATTTYPTGVTASAAGGAGAAFSYSTASSACSVNASSGVVTINSVGSCAITATATAANYADATDTKTMTIGAAATTTVVTVANATFDGAPHGGTALVTGPGGLSQTLTVSYVGRNGTTYPSSTTAPTNAGDYTASASYAAAGNYLGSTDSQDFSIGKATATISVNGFTGPYDGAAHGATGTATGVGGVSLSGLNLGASFTDVPGGTANWTFTDVTGNYGNATGTANIVISKANQSITFGALANKTYGDAAFSVSATASSGLTVDFSVSGNCSISGSSVSITGAGSCTVTAKQAGNGNYNAATDVARSFDIAKANATITVNGYSGVYDAAAHGATGTATGIGGVDLSSLLSLGASFTNVPGGTANWSFAGDANYEAASGTAAITITKADASITVDGYTGVFDGNAHGATGSAKGVGGVNLAGLDLGASFTNVPGGTANWTFTDATGNYNNASGTAAIVISKANATISVQGYTGVYDAAAHGATGSATGVGGVSLAGLNLGASYTNVPGGTASWTFTDATGNYNDASGSVEITISKADATISVSGYTGVYDGDAHGATGSATGIGGAPLSGLSLGESFTNVPGGTANWSFTDVTGNYNNASGTAAIVITKANATISVNGYTGVYDGAAHGATGSATGVKGETLAGLSLGASFTNVPGGTANWTYTDATGNYNNASGSASIVITKANATVSVSGYTGVYDGDPHGATGSATGVKGEALTGLDLGSSFTNVPGGTASWSFTDATGNYNNATGTAAIVISKANATIAVDGYTGTYDGNSHGASGTAKGVKGETLTGLNLGATFTNVPGGTANWTYTDATGNYNDASGSAAIVLAKANATINVSGYTGVYDAAAHGATGSAVGVKNEALTGLDLGASFTNVPGGTASWTFTDITGNYNDAAGTAAIVITQATPTVTAVGGSFTFDALPHPGSGSATGIGGADLGAVTLSYTKDGSAFAGSPVNAGNYEVTASYAGSTNYKAGTSTAAAIEIAKANATITVNGYTGVYDGSAHGATGTATGVGGASLAGLDLGASFTNVPGGTANWAFTDVTGNYNNASGTAAIVITQATPSVTAVGGSFTFDNVAHAGSGTATGVAGADLGAVTLTYTKSGSPFAGSPINAGSYEATAHYAGSTNYTAGTSAPVVIEIAKANATITVDGYTGIYDGEAHGATGTAKGVGGVNLGGLSLGATFTNVPGGTASWKFTDVTGNYNDAEGTAAIVITKANATINVNGYTGVFDGAAHGATGTAKGVKGEALAGLNLGASITNVPGGTANWTFTDVTGNYNDADGTAAIVLSKANATIAVDGYTGVYDGNAHGATGTAKGVGGVSLAGLDLGSSFTNAPGGTATWTFTDATGNYNGATGTAAIVITKATPTVTAVGGSFTYDAVAHPGSGSAKGVGAVDLGAVSLSYTKSGSPFAGSPVNAGSYEVTATYAGSTNYTAGTSAPVAIVIGKATIAAPVLSDLVKPYNGAKQKPIVTTTPSGVTVTLDFIQNTASVGGNDGVSGVGVYRVVAAITDNNYTGLDGTGYFVIYDPNGGFVTGGGWINSPTGACKLATCTEGTTGKANFGFVSKYQNGANKTPTLTGNTEFQFQAGNLNFKSTSYEWLTVSGARAQYKGSGTINGSGNYQFILTAIDGSLPGGNNQDRFRIKITDANGVVYDNQMMATDDAGLTTPGTVLGGGSINIKK